MCISAARDAPSEDRGCSGAHHVITQNRHLVVTESNLPRCRQGTRTHAQVQTLRWSKTSFSGMTVSIEATSTRDLTIALQDTQGWAFLLLLSPDLKQCGTVHRNLPLRIQYTQQLQYQGASWNGGSRAESSLLQSTRQRALVCLECAWKSISRARLRLIISAGSKQAASQSN